VSPLSKACGIDNKSSKTTLLQTRHHHTVTYYRTIGVIVFDDAHKV